MSKKDPAGSLTGLIDGIVMQHIEDLDVAFPAEVVSFDKDKQRATIKPRIKNGEDEPALIQDVRCVMGGRFVNDDGTEYTQRPLLKKGDIVIVVCSDYEIKNAFGGTAAAPDTNRRHSLNDAVIVGVFLWSR